jgi:hypothetical protein
MSLKNLQKVAKACLTYYHSFENNHKNYGWKIVFPKTLSWKCDSHKNALLNVGYPP